MNSKLNSVASVNLYMHPNMIMNVVFCFADVSFPHHAVITILDCNVALLSVILQSYIIYAFG